MEFHLIEGYYITFYMIIKTNMHSVLIYIDNILKMGFDVLWD